MLKPTYTVLTTKQINAIRTKEAIKNIAIIRNKQIKELQQLENYREFYIKQINALYFRILEYHVTEEKIAFALKNSAFMLRFRDQLTVNKEKRKFYIEELRKNKCLMITLQRSLNKE